MSDTWFVVLSKRLLRRKRGALTMRDVIELEVRFQQMIVARR